MLRLYSINQKPESKTPSIIFLIIFVEKEVSMKAINNVFKYILVTVTLGVSIQVYGQDKSNLEGYDSISSPSINLDLLNRYLEDEYDVNQWIFESVKLPKSKLNERFTVDKLNLPIYQPLILKDKSPLHQGEYYTNGLIHQFSSNDILWGSGGQNNLIGFGEINYGNVIYQKQLNGRLLIGAHLSAVTIRAPHMATNTFEGGINLSYQITDKLAFHAFGNYTFGETPPIMGTLYTNSSFGGYFSIEMSERFGLGLGAQRYYDPTVGNWSTAPIVVPYYKINKKITIGMDIGGLIQELIKNAINKGSEENTTGGKFQGTIMPPKQRIPIR